MKICQSTELGSFIFGDFGTAGLFFFIIIIIIQLLIISKRLKH